MTTYTTKPAVVQNVINHPTIEKSIMNNNDNVTYVPYEIEGAGFFSQRLAQRVGFLVSAEIGKVATRIQKLANPPRSFQPTKEGIKEIKDEIKESIQRLIWGYNNVGEHMRSIEDCIAEWCGGGYSRPRTDAEIEQVAEALGITKEQAKQSAESNRSHSKDYLTIRRAGLAPVMVEKITKEIQKNYKPIEPDEDKLAACIDGCFANAVLWGDWAEAALIKSDSVYHIGRAPTAPTMDKTQSEKAARIRDQLAADQAESAARDARKLVEFDLDLAA